VQDKPQKTVIDQVRFGVFEVNLETGELYRSGIRIRLQSQPFKLLAVLLEHAGEVVPRETLQHELWGTDTTVDFDHSLGIAINKLREALGDSADNPRFVETLAKRGYRFIAPVSPVEPATTEPATVSVTPATVPQFNQLSRWVIAGLAAICLALGAMLLLWSPVRAL
jgi:DNA-binding winged helix-turn-helix (wHTH) protein